MGIWQAGVAVRNRTTRVRFSHAVEAEDASLMAELVSGDACFLAAVTMLMDEWLRSA